MQQQLVKFGQHEVVGGFIAPATIALRPENDWTYAQIGFFAGDDKTGL